MSDIYEKLLQENDAGIRKAPAQQTWTQYFLGWKPTEQQEKIQWIREKHQFFKAVAADKGLPSDDQTFADVFKEYQTRCAAPTKKGKTSPTFENVFEEYRWKMAIANHERFEDHFSKRTSSSQYCQLMQQMEGKNRDVTRGHLLDSFNAFVEQSQTNPYSTPPLASVKYSDHTIDSFYSKKETHLGAFVQTYERETGKKAHTNNKFSTDFIDVYRSYLSLEIDISREHELLKGKIAQQTVFSTPENKEAYQIAAAQTRVTEDSFPIEDVCKAAIEADQIRKWATEFSRGNPNALRFGHHIYSPDTASPLQRMIGGTTLELYMMYPSKYEAYKASRQVTNKPAEQTSSAAASREDVEHALNELRDLREAKATAIRDNRSLKGSLDKTIKKAESLLKVGPSGNSDRWGATLNDLNTLKIKLSDIERDSKKTGAEVGFDATKTTKTSRRKR